MIHALLPLYLTTTLGRRKPLILFGYGLGALSKPFFAMADAPGTVLAARFADRIGKGMRGAPRDALVADVTPKEIRGRAYGLRQSLDTVGAFLGPALALGLIAAYANDMRLVFWLAVIPAALAVALVIFGVEDAAAGPERGRRGPPIKAADLRRMPRAFWAITAVGVAFTLARFSEAFLVLRAHDLGLPIGLAPLTLIAMNVIYALGAYPAGSFSDTMRPETLLLWALAALVGADLALALAFATGLVAAFAGVALWGVHMALSQGLLAKLIADAAPDNLRGTAFGVFNFGCGVMMFAASLVAGLAWDRIGPQATFMAGAGFAALAALLVAALRRAPAPAA